MKLKFTRKTWYFFLLAAAAVSMLGGFAVLGGMDFSALELVAFCLTGIAALFLAAQKGAPAAEKRNYTLVFVLLMLSKLAAGGWAGDLCSALVWPALLGIEYSRGKPIQRQLQLVCVAEVLRTVFWLLTRYAGMAGLAFWTNLLFVLLACARGWAALTLYKLQEEELRPGAAGKRQDAKTAAWGGAPFCWGPGRLCVPRQGWPCAGALPLRPPTAPRSPRQTPTRRCRPGSGGPCG